jgi:phytoene desaturase
LFIGGNPFDSSAIYAMVQYLERKWGVHYVLGGTGALVAAMARLFTDLGGVLHLNTPVSEILVEGRRVTGLRLADGQRCAADSVISNADVTYTYQNLIPAQHRRVLSDRKLHNMSYSMSLVVIYLGTKRSYRDAGLAHHNIIFGERYKGLLHDIFGRKRLPSDFSLYLHMPSISDTSLAPAGCEAMYVLAPVPHLGSGTDWAQVRKGYRDTIIQFLEDHYLPDLQANIAVEHMVDPRYFRDTMNNYYGAAFGMQPTLLQSAWFRPHNRSEEFANLYLVGAGTHPGAGLPGVLASAVIAQNLIGAA